MRKEVKRWLERMWGEGRRSLGELAPKGGYDSPDEWGEATDYWKKKLQEEKDYLRSVGRNPNVGGSRLPHAERVTDAMWQMYKKPLKDRRISDATYRAMAKLDLAWQEPTGRWNLTGKGLGYVMARKNPGSRFKALAKKVKSKALAAWIGRKKYGKKRFAKMAAAGRRAKRNGWRQFQKAKAKRRRYAPAWTLAQAGRSVRRSKRRGVRRNFSHKHWGKMNTFLGIAASAFVIYHYVNKYRTKGTV